MKNKTLVFYDFEASSTARDCDPISLGLVAITDKSIIETLEDTLTEKEAIKLISTIAGLSFEIEGLYISTASRALEFVVHKTSDEEVNSKREVKGRENWGFHTFITKVYQVDSTTKVEVTVSYYNHPAHGNMNGEYQLESIKKITELVEEKSFYCEFNDFDENKCDDWVKENIINKLQLGYLKDNFNNSVYINGVDDITDSNNIKMLGTQSHISKHLKEWLLQFESTEFYSDLDTIDKPLLIDLITDWDYNNIQRWGDSSPPVLLGERKYKIGLPKHLPNINYYDFYDLNTIFKIKNIDPDINREEFVGVDSINKHNSLHDARVIKDCYYKLIEM